MKVHIRTYGCQMNERDSEAVGAMLLSRGHQLVAEESDAEVVIVNTCSVRAKAEEKAVGKLRLLVESRRERPGLVVGAIGCMVQRTGLDLFTAVRGLDFAVGPRRLSSLPALLDRVMSGQRPLLDTTGDESDPDSLTGHSVDGVTAFVTVTGGCSRGCTYCVVPAVRGRETSRPAAGILREVSALASSGVKEVTLLGQSVTSYGGTGDDAGLEGFPSPLGLREPFPRLLELVAGVPGLERVRFTSSHPSGMTGELIRVMRAMPALCEHIHLPVQSGSDRILDLMNRGYTAAGYRDAALRLREAIQDLSITTDIIVGFPTETARDFDATRALMKEIQFDNAFIFKYSPRPDTVAAGWADDVPAEEKLRRNKVILEDQDAACLARNERLAGRELEVLIEGPSLRNRSRWSGRTRNNKIMIVESGDGITGPCMATVKTGRCMPQTLYGHVTGVKASYGLARAGAEHGRRQ